MEDELTKTKMESLKMIPWNMKIIYQTFMTFGLHVCFPGVCSSFWNIESGYMYI